MLKSPSIYQLRRDTHVNALQMGRHRHFGHVRPLFRGSAGNVT
jgi:hypothetical protein